MGPALAESSGSRKVLQRMGTSSPPRKQERFPQFSCLLAGEKWKNPFPGGAASANQLTEQILLPSQDLNPQSMWPLVCLGPLQTKPARMTQSCRSVSEGTPTCNISGTFQSLLYGSGTRHVLGDGVFCTMCYNPGTVKETCHVSTISQPPSR